MTYRVIYYPKGESSKIINGFSSREAAWLWVKDHMDDIDCYKIESEVSK